ncbi:MAG: nucleotide exchange factor GrpE [Pikeienuella sp.]
MSETKKNEAEEMMADVEILDDEVVAEEIAEEEELDPVEAELAELRAERDDLKDKLMRALAEAQNTRHRAERDRKDAEAYGGTKLARDLLSVHDNLERALKAVEDDVREQAAGLIEGVELTQKDLLSAFSKHKINMVNPEAGDKFDPNMHQAMFEAPIPGAEAGTIIEVMQAGFSISGRLLRPALVGVARAAPEA